MLDVYVVCGFYLKKDSLYHRPMHPRPCSIRRQSRRHQIADSTWRLWRTVAYWTASCFTICPNTMSSPTAPSLPHATETDIFHLTSRRQLLISREADYSCHLTQSSCVAPYLDRPSTKIGPLFTCGSHQTPLIRGGKEPFLL